MCDRALVTNEYLADKMRVFRPSCDVRIIPNFLNNAQAELSRRIHAIKRDGGYRGDGRIHVGYFSGTPTHNKDFAIVADALAKLFVREKRLVLRLVGFLRPAELLRRFPDRIEHHGLQDFLNLQRLIGATEFNLVPLQDNSFTNCKSELKYFEAAITGTISLASPTHVFRSAICDGQNGYLVNSTDWEERIGAALEARPDYRGIAEASARHAEAHYSGDVMRDVIESAIFGQ
jgi:glycosyltransferase involved in cell wall biosynthesis